MVIYDLQCVNHHQFEGWFKNAEDLTHQQASGLLVCPICETTEVGKKLTAAKVGKKSNTATTHHRSSKISSVASVSDAQVYQQVQKMLGEVHRHIEKNFTDVGNRFADEALKIHKGEKDAENIRGTASKAELKELAEEGVSALPLPPKPVDKSKLN